jgi:hypothetical protein
MSIAFLAAAAPTVVKGHADANHRHFWSGLFMARESTLPGSADFRPENLDQMQDCVTLLNVPDP